MAGVYLSYPFCAQKCTYCNFASGVFPRGVEERYPEALRAELRAAEWPWTPDTVYLGGGTPSQLDPAALTALLAEIPGQSEDDRWTEATMEAAPGGITADKAAAWRRAGINRVSLGVQSFEPAELRQTGRKHTAEVVAREAATLRDAGISAMNVDLIAGLPHQTRASWLQSLEWVERLEVPHVSVYMLEVDGDSRLGSELIAFGTRYGAPEVPTDDQVADFYEIAVERLASIGIPRYEISNFARPGCESRHNLKYWLREPYLGFGADAHSFDGSTRWQNIEDAPAYVDALAHGRSSVASREPADAASERFFLGLRLDRGIPDEPSPFAAAIDRFVSEGLLERGNGRLRLTPRGVLLSNEVFAEFVEAPV